MTAKYAASTTVGTDKTKADIEKLLVKYQADSFAYGWQEGSASIGFRIAGRTIRMMLPLPDIEEFFATPTGLKRSENSKREAYEQAVRTRWRALHLVIKARLEAVECGITCMEAEFLNDTVMANGQTVGEWLAPDLKAMYAGGPMPARLMLPAM